MTYLDKYQFYCLAQCKTCCLNFVNFISINFYIILIHTLFYLFPGWSGSTTPIGGCWIHGGVPRTAALGGGHPKGTSVQLDAGRRGSGAALLALRLAHTGVQHGDRVLLIKWGAGKGLEGRRSSTVAVAPGIYTRPKGADRSGRTPPPNTHRAPSLCRVFAVLPVVTDWDKVFKEPLL